MEKLSRPAAMNRALQRQRWPDAVNAQIRVEPGLVDAEGSAQARHRDGSIRLEQLRVRLDAHLADVVACVLREQARRGEVGGLDLGCRISVEPQRSGGPRHRKYLAYSPL